MSYKNVINTVAVATVIFLAGTAISVSAQGRPGGTGRPATAGPPAGTPAGPPTGSPGVDRGLGRASERSNGRSDDGLNTASQRSNGRSDAGIDRARQAQMNAARMSDNDLNRYRGISQQLGTTPAEMRAQYQAALMTNPNLSYGNFVAANIIAERLNDRFTNVTSAAILSGLANGSSIGQTLKSLRVSETEAKDARRYADEQIKMAKKRKK
jgi:hypothetical protein